MKTYKSLLFRGQKTIRPTSKSVDSSYGTGQVPVRTGNEQITYDVYVIGAGFEGMARTAAKNKSGRSVDGCIEVRVISRKEV